MKLPSKFPTQFPNRILGLDPGLEHTGYGVIEVSGNHHKFIACGRITTKTSDEIPQRLAVIAAGISEVIRQFKPTTAAVEEVYVNTNARSSLKLGQARGVCLLIPTQHNLPVHEYAARLVKKSLTGNGAAEKNQISHMVKVLLANCNPTSPDAADALAVALTHAHHHAFNRQLKAS